MGSFGSFLYINEFFGDESLFGCPPFVVSSTPSIHMDAGRRDMLGRTHTSMSAIRRTLAPEDRPRLDAALTGDEHCREYNCISCGTREDIRNDQGTASHHQNSRSHFWSCPSLLAHRRARCLAMADTVASFGTMMHHAHHLRHHASDRSTIPTPGDVTITTSPVIRRADHDGEPSLISVAVSTVYPSYTTRHHGRLFASLSRTQWRTARLTTPSSSSSSRLTTGTCAP